MKKFTKDKFVIVFKSDDYDNTLILHNSYFDDIADDFIPIEPSDKNSKLSPFASSPIGYFNSIEEAKAYIYSKRFMKLENYIKRIINNDEHQGLSPRYIKAVVESYIGERNKLKEVIKKHQKNFLSTIYENA